MLVVLQMAENDKAGKMRNGQIRLLFLLLAAGVAIMTFVMHQWIGPTSHAILRDFFLMPWSSGHPKGVPAQPRMFPGQDVDNKNRAQVILGEKHDIDWEKLSHGHQHDHNQEVRFVLRESNLGAPAFVGRNILDRGTNTGDVGKSKAHGMLNGTLPEWKPVMASNKSIAIGCGITTRKQGLITADSLITDVPFFKGLLASFCYTATADYDYHFYVSHDHDDPFFQTEMSHRVFQMAFYTIVANHCPNSFNVSLHLVECNHTGHPAWAQNDAMMAAYMDNMEFYYRVNDDTIMESSGWTEKLIAELARMNPPYVGVVGPFFREGNYAILTHDFVHRTHIDVFGFYYPRVFTDWFADDWITGVYHPARSRKLPMVRVKHTMEQGSRYVVHFEKAGKVDLEVKVGRTILSRWLEQHENAMKSPAHSEKNNLVVAFSLYGENIDMLYGAMRYAQLVPVMYPQWVTRVFAMETGNDMSHTLRIVLRKLELSGIQVHRLDREIADHIHPSLWPYLIADDTNVERFIIRYSTGRPTEREAAVLEDWLQSNTSWYCIRDHPRHAASSLVPGLVGGMPALLRQIMNDSFANLIKQAPSEKYFLQNILWPRVTGATFCHDSVSCSQWRGSHPFPLLRKESEYIGQSYDANDELLSNEDSLSWNRAYSSPDCVFVQNTGFSQTAVRAVIRTRPVFWSQDFHITPMMDIKSLLKPIGVRMIEKSLSFSCASAGNCGTDLKVINKYNGMKLTANLTSQFYEAYHNDSEMLRVTTFVCTLPVSMCEAFVSFNKSILIIANTRYEMGRTDPESWIKLNRLLQDVQQSAKGIVAANNVYDANYIEYFTGIKPVLLPNFCGYLNATYTPTRRHFLVTPIHSTELHDKFFTDFDNAVIRKDADLTVFPLREMYPQYLFSDLAAHPGIIYVPYQVSMVSFTEQYRMNIPMFLPSLTLLAQWHLQYQVVRQRTWNLYRSHLGNQSTIPGLRPDLPDPNNDLDEESVRFWLQFADYYQWPHITYYESVEDLVDKLLTVNLKDISAKMIQYNAKTRVAIKQAWSQVLLTLSDGKHQQPDRG